jgi:U3 small nucleolar ribonucleoprotein component
MNKFSKDKYSTWEKDKIEINEKINLIEEYK